MLFALLLASAFALGQSLDPPSADDTGDPTCMHDQLAEVEAAIDLRGDDLDELRTAAAELLELIAQDLPVPAPSPADPPLASEVETGDNSDAPPVPVPEVPPPED